MARIVSRDLRSVTGRNVALLTEVAGLSPWDYTKCRIQENLLKTAVPSNDEWRSGLLMKLLEERRNSLEHEYLDRLIDSLCTT